MWCESRGGIVTNCTISGNLADYFGAGVYGTTLNNCSVSGNHAVFGNGGGVYISTLNDCMVTGNRAENFGGGATFCLLNRCTVSGNHAASKGGGAWESTASNSTFFDNSAVSVGGGVSDCFIKNCLLRDNFSGNGGGSFYGTLKNCTVCGNTAVQDGGGAFGGTLENCIVWYNNADGKNDIYITNAVSFTCSPDVAHRVNGCITNAPQFVDVVSRDYHLSGGSACINSGNNADAPMPNDLDGNDRILGGVVDMGAYEWIQLLNPSGAIPAINLILLEEN